MSKKCLDKAKQGGYGVIEFVGEEAIKRTKLFTCNGNQLETGNIKEAIFFRQVHGPHPHRLLTQIRGVSLEGQTILLKQDKYPQDLLDYIFQHPFEKRSKRVCEISENIAESLAFMHHKGFIHGDIKPSNILMDKHDTPMLSDFGSMPTFRQNASYTWVNSRATYGFRAPELFLKKCHQNEKTDAFAFGLTLYAFLLKKVPFQHLDDAKESGAKRIKTEYELQIQNGKTAVDTNDLVGKVPAEFLALLKPLLLFDPVKRSSVTDFLVNLRKPYFSYESPERFSVTLNTLTPSSQSSDARHIAVMWMYYTAVARQIPECFVLAVSILDRFTQMLPGCFADHRDACSVACLMLADCLVTDAALTISQMIKSPTITTSQEDVQWCICNILRCLDWQIYSDTFDWTLRVTKSDYGAICKIVIAGYQSQTRYQQQYLEL